MNIGIDLGGTNIRLGVIENASILKKECISCPSYENAKEVLNQLKILIKNNINKEIKGIGIGVPSVVDVEKGIVYNVTNIPSWKCAGRPCFHISLVQDISPNCDCHGENDAPILPDIGIFASFDPVALDQACADACLNAQPLPNSQLGQNLAKPGWNCHHDNFKDSNPNIEWKATLEQAEKIGMGTRQYTLKKI